MDAMDKGDVVCVGVYYLTVVDGDVLLFVCRQQFRQQAEKCLVFTLAFAQFGSGERNFKGRLCGVVAHYSTQRTKYFY
jgi:hypothetical protein